MVKLFCALVGVEEDTFSVVIEDSESMSDLKEAIKLKKANDLHRFDAKQTRKYTLQWRDGRMVDFKFLKMWRLSREEKTTTEINDLTHKDI